MPNKFVKLPLAAAEGFQRAALAQYAGGALDPSCTATTGLFHAIEEGNSVEFLIPWGYNQYIPNPHQSSDVSEIIEARWQANAALLAGTG